LLVFAVVTSGGQQSRDPTRETTNQVWQAEAVQEGDGNDTTFNDKVSKQIYHNKEVIIIIQ